MPVSEWLRILLIISSFVVGFWLPIRIVGYIPPTSLEVFFDLLVSAVSICSISIYFSDREISPRTLSNWLKPKLMMDLLCLFPFSLWFFFSDSQASNPFIFINLLAVRHVSQIKKFLDNFDDLSPLAYRLTPIFMTLPLLVHTISCIWIALGSGNIGPDPDATTTYIKAVYWAFTTLTTVGYGDISAKTSPQMLFTCGVQLIGVGVFGYILSSVAGLIARTDAAREHHMDNMDRVETFMRIHHVPAELRSRIRAYYHFIWKNKKGYNDHSVLSHLPDKIQSELYFHINQGVLEKVPFLKGAENDILQELMLELRPTIFVPGERIFKAGDPGDAVYFIHQGEVAILNDEQHRVATLTEGHFFGEMALIDDRPRMASAVSVTFTDLYVLKRDEFKKFLRRHPHFHQHMNEVVSARRAG